MRKARGLGAPLLEYALDSASGFPIAFISLISCMLKRFLYLTMIVYSVIVAVGSLTAVLVIAAEVVAVVAVVVVAAVFVAVTVVVVVATAAGVVIGWVCGSP